MSLRPVEVTCHKCGVAKATTKPLNLLGVGEQDVFYLAAACLADKGWCVRKNDDGMEYMCCHACATEGQTLADLPEYRDNPKCPACGYSMGVVTFCRGQSIDCNRVDGGHVHRICERCKYQCLFKMKTVSRTGFYPPATSTPR